ncbi:MAG TPA: hypothetical protein VFX89_00675 [Gammaproteobacteria bacterium]|nr:hypothetical protein [Gammaproteobacteria bacterium]
MRNLLVCIALCVPVAANADLMFIKYEGTVSGIEEQGCPCPQSYAIGDPVSGQLTIDLGIVRRGGGANAQTGDYTSENGQFDFISGRPLAGDAMSNDGFFLYNDLPYYLPQPANATYDRVEVYDGIGPSPLDMLGITVERLSSYGPLMTDARLPPEFDAKPEEGTTLTGRILRGLSGAAGAFKQTIDVAFTHVSMGVCNRPT